MTGVLSGYRFFSCSQALREKNDTVPPYILFFRKEREKREHSPSFVEINLEKISHAARIHAAVAGVAGSFCSCPLQVE